MKKAILIALSAALSGCAGGWSKPSATEAEFNQDRYQCQAQAASMYPVYMTQTAYGGGYQAPSQTRCTGYGNTLNCTTMPGAYTPPPVVTQDSNAVNRASAFNSCMQSMGYTYNWK